LPEEIGKLENLTKINLNHNQLIELPMKFFDMRNLRTLTFCHNKMVDIRYFKIHKLPEGLQKFKLEISKFLVKGPTDKEDPAYMNCIVSI